MQEAIDTEESRCQFQYAYGIDDGVNPVQESSGAPVTANILTGLGIDEFFTRSIPGDPSATRHLLPDALDSTVALTNDDGAVQTEYTYEPFGRTTVTGEASTNPFQFTGRENDGTGLYYYRARYYHPIFQRFISEDPYLHPTYGLCLAGGLVPGATNLVSTAFDNAQGLNTYAYVGNAPLNFTDPKGLQAAQGVAAGLRACLANPSCASALGALLGLTGLELSRLKDLSIPKDDWRQQCIDLFVQCKTQKWDGPCGDCLNKCTAQHEWDFDMCRPKRGSKSEQ